MSKSLATCLLVFTVIITAACGSNGESGLKCKSGDLYLDGKQFTSCSQCQSDDCGFEDHSSETCTYPNGVQECTVSNGTVTARCAGQTATVVISNGVHSCGASTSDGGSGGGGTTTSSGGAAGSTMNGNNGTGGGAGGTACVSPQVVPDLGDVSFHIVAPLSEQLLQANSAPGSVEATIWYVSGDGSTAVGVSTYSPGCVSGSAVGQAFRWTAVGGTRSLGTLPGMVKSQPGGVSRDGRVVVGTATDASGMTQAFRWTQETGIMAIADNNSDVSDVSADGLVIVGDVGKSAFRWTEATGAVVLPLLPGSRECMADHVSADGTVILGRCQDPTTGLTTIIPRWDATGVSRLQVSGFPSVLSVDANVVAGDETDANYNSQAFRWDRQAGATLLGFPPGDKQSRVNDMSSDGSVVIGRADAEAFRWTTTAGMVGLGHLGPTDGFSEAKCITEDGTTIAGSSGSSGVLWNAVSGWSRVSDAAVAAGSDLKGWLPSDACVSKNGTSVYGNAADPQGNQLPYVWFVL